MPLIIHHWNILKASKHFQHSLLQPGNFGKLWEPNFPPLKDVDPHPVTSSNPPAVLPQLPKSLLIEALKPRNGIPSLITADVQDHLPGHRKKQKTCWTTTTTTTTTTCWSFWLIHDMRYQLSCLHVQFYVKKVWREIFLSGHKKVVRF